MGISRRAVAAELSCGRGEVEVLRLLFAYTRHRLADGQRHVTLVENRPAQQILPWFFYSFVLTCP